MSSTDIGAVFSVICAFFFRRCHSFLLTCSPLRRRMASSQNAIQRFGISVASEKSMAPVKILRHLCSALFILMVLVVSIAMASCACGWLRGVS